MKYIVMETHTSYAVVLDEQGSFFLAANLNYTPGQIVEHPELLRTYGIGKEKKTVRRNRILGVAAAAAACLFMVFGINSYMLRTTVYGSVFMTVNPEVQITLNKQGDVIDVTGLNEDGMLLVEKQDYEGLSASEACSRLTEYAVLYDKLQDGGAVLFEIDTEDEAFRQSVGASIRTGVRETLDDTVDADLYVTDYADGFDIPAKETPSPSPSAAQSANIALPSPSAQQPTPSAPPVPSSASTPAPTRSTAPVYEDDDDDDDDGHDDDDDHDDNDDNDDSDEDDDD